MTFWLPTLPQTGHHFWIWIIPPRTILQNLFDCLVFKEVSSGKEQGMARYTGLGWLPSLQFYLHSSYFLCKHGLLIQSMFWGKTEPLFTVYYPYETVCKPTWGRWDICNLFKQKHWTVILTSRHIPSVPWEKWIWTRWLKPSTGARISSTIDFSKVARKEKTFQLTSKGKGAGNSGQRQRETRGCWVLTCKHPLSPPPTHHFLPCARILSTTMQAILLGLLTVPWF